MNTKKMIGPYEQKDEIKKAIIQVIYEAYRDKRTKSGAARTVKSLKSIGFDGVDLVEILYALEICDNEGNPYKPLERTW